MAIYRFSKWRPSAILELFRENTSEITNHLGQLGSKLCVVGRIGSGVRVSVSFEIFALRKLLHSVGGTYGGFL